VNVKNENLENHICPVEYRITIPEQLSHPVVLRTEKLLALSTEDHTKRILPKRGVFSHVYFSRERLGRALRIFYALLTYDRNAVGSRARAWRNGIRSGLKENLSARLGNRRCRTAQIREILNGNPEPSPERPSREGVETRRAPPKLRRPPADGEGIVQTANLARTLQGVALGRRKP
jgi:hypothetical protein